MASGEVNLEGSGLGVPVFQKPRSLTSFCQMVPPTTTVHPKLPAFRASFFGSMILYGLRIPTVDDMNPALP